MASPGVNLVPNRQARRRCRWPRRLHGRGGSSFPTRPRPTPLPCLHGLGHTCAQSAARVVASPPTNRRTQRCPNRRRRRRDHGCAKLMSLALHQHPLVQETVGPQCGIRIEVFAINRVPAPGSGHCQERVSLFSRCTADHAFWVRAIPCSTVAQQRHKIIRNGVALVREET
jgi:hypothetical protein